MSIGCEYYESLLLRLPDGDFTDVEADALREHLRTCRDCRRLFKALEAAANVLAEEQEPPAELAGTVMERVYAAKDAAAARGASARRTRAAGKRRWRAVAVAACLVLVVGGAAYFATNLLDRMGSSDASAESISLEAAAKAEDPAAVFEPDFEDAGAEVVLDAVEAPAAGAPMEEAAEAEFALEADIAADTDRDEPVPAPRFDWPATSWMEPAQVPEGMEEDFEAVITDSHEDASMTTAAWDVIAYVEYKGVIYEFLTDDSQEALMWRDAAEGLFPCLSPLPTDALWAIIGS